MSDLLERLQDMVIFKHDDKDVAREAIEEIVKLEAQHGEQANQISRLWAAREALQQQTAVQATRIAELEAAVHDMAKYVWRGDWNQLKPETRAILDQKK